jgi:hypothetical protein
MLKITDAVGRRQPDMSETSHIHCIPITLLHAMLDGDARARELAWPQMGC